MCGIVGMVTNSEFGGIRREIDAFADMLYMDALRGWDSTGVAVYSNDGELRITKEASDANFFLSTKEFQEISTQYISKGKAIIGHNRKRTVGKIEDATAHPFLVNDRYGFVHNGTLQNHKKIANTEVDSEALAQHLTKCNGEVSALEDALGQVSGAYACAWIDKQKEHLYLLRNAERPLYYAKFDGGWLFCSEPGFLQLSFTRHTMKITEVQAVPIDTLVKFDLSGGASPPTLTKLTIKKSTASIYTPVVSGLMIPTETVSKNQYKRIAKKGLVGQAVSFFMEDYVERVVGEADKNKWVIWGKGSKLNFPHKILANLDGPTQDQMIDFYPDVVFNGIVNSMNYNPKEKLVVIHVGKLTYTIKEPVNETTTTLH